MTNTLLLARFETKGKRGLYLKHVFLRGLRATSLNMATTMVLAGCAIPVVEEPRTIIQMRPNLHFNTCTQNCETPSDDVEEVLPVAEPEANPETTVEAVEKESTPKETGPQEQATNPVEEKAAPSEIEDPTGTDTAKPEEEQIPDAATGEYTIWIDAPGKVASGSTLKVLIRVRDPDGNPVNTSLLQGSKFTVTWQGPGLLFQGTPEATDADGEAQFVVLLGANDSGSASVLVIFNTDNSDPFSDILGFKQIDIG